MPKVVQLAGSHEGTKFLSVWVKGGFRTSAELVTTKQGSPSRKEETSAEYVCLPG